MHYAIIHIIKFNKQEVILIKFAFIDTETGGFDPQQHDLISIAILTDKKEYFTKIKPQLPVSPEAAKINGYNELEWANAPTLNQVIDKINSLIKGRYMVAHNAKFDYDFLTISAKRSNVKLALDYHICCTAQLAMEHLPLQKVNLAAVCKFLHIELINAHNALADAHACKAVFQKLWKCSTLQRLWYRLYALCH